MASSLIMNVKPGSDHNKKTHAGIDLAWEPFFPHFIVLPNPRKQ
jgi:hypothetical protein